MKKIEVVFKYKEKEVKSIYSDENDNVYEIFKKNNDFIEDNKTEYQLFFENKIINKKTAIKDLAKKEQKIVIIVKPSIDSINIRYKMRNQESKINLFGKEFVEKNKNISKFIYEGNEYDLVPYFEIPNYESLIKNGINEISIILTNINKLTDISHMFQYSDFLYSDDMPQWDTKNINDISFLFSDCSTLISIPDISNWDTSNIINISELFYNCYSLTSLPDISKWDTSNIKYMRNIFKDCRALISIPNISKWNIKNCTNICAMFQGCLSLKEIPDISKWDISNIIDLSYFFYDCQNLTKIPDISNWDTTNVKSFRGLFWNCIGLTSIPDISKWNTKNNLNLSNMFYNCSQLISLPDLSKWDTFNVMNMGNMFNIFFINIYDFK